VRYLNASGTVTSSVVRIMIAKWKHQLEKHSVPVLIRRCDDLPAAITHVPVAAVLVLNTPDDGRLRPKLVEWPCRNKTCTVLHQVGVSFDLYYDARKHKIKITLPVSTALTRPQKHPKYDRPKLTKNSTAPLWLS